MRPSRPFPHLPPCRASMLQGRGRVPATRSTVNSVHMDIARPRLSRLWAALGREDENRDRPGCRRLNRDFAGYSEWLGRSWRENLRPSLTITCPMFAELSCSFRRTLAVSQSSILHSTRRLGLRVLLTVSFWLCYSPAPSFSSGRPAGKPLASDAIAHQWQRLSREPRRSGSEGDYSYVHHCGMIAA